MYVSLPRGRPVGLSPNFLRGGSQDLKFNIFVTEQFFGSIVTNSNLLDGLNFI